MFGLHVVTPGDSDGSALIKALEGRPPFGCDFPGQPGATYRRMPAGRPPVEVSRIEFMRRWIADGCPDDEVVPPAPQPPPPLAVDPAPAAPLDPASHNAYWRDFENWAMFQTTQDVQEAINEVFERAPLWFAHAVQGAPLDPWVTANQEAPARRAFELLSAR